MVKILDKNTKIYFTLNIGYGRGASQEDEFTLGELGIDPETEKDIATVLEREWKEWSLNFIDGGWSFKGN